MGLLSVYRRETTKGFRDNLREDKFYITGLAVAGFTNQFMSYVNMIYLGTLSQQIPIIPAFGPCDHISWSAGAIPFGHIFNLSRARDEIKHPLLEWMDINHLVPYIFPGSPLSPSNKPYRLMQVSPLGHSLPPDEHLACFDLLYYATSSSQAFKREFLWSPAWNLIGTHLHFTDDLIRLAKDYLGRAFSRPVDGIPPFIAIHMRRNDFEDKCDLDKFVTCFIPLGTFQRIASSMKEEIYYRDNIKVEHILLTSDEKNLAFWHEAKKLGWAHIDHLIEKTQETYGEWYLPIIDMIVQSMAAGFLGTKGSTFSLVSSRRIRDWNDGPAILLSQMDRAEVDFVSNNY